MTQGPLQPGNQALPVPATQTGDLFHTFPGTGPGTSATSAFANLALDHAYPANLAPCPITT
jgi:hypothetical protein